MAVTAATTPRVSVRAIGPADVPAVAAFLHANLPKRVPADTWARALDVPWRVEPPNAGFLLLDGDEVVGAHLAFYSDRTIDGRTERICNLGAWCVLPDHRFHALRLLKALLAQDDYHFTDLSPSGSVRALNLRLGFRWLDTTATLVPNLPLPSRPGRIRISSDPALLERTLSPGELEIYRDHATSAAVRHLLLMRDDAWCYVMFRKERRKGLPLFASIMHVSDPEQFRALSATLPRRLLLRHGTVATLIEHAVAAHRPRLSLTVDSRRPKMFRSPSLEPGDIDYLYSELVRLPW